MQLKASKSVQTLGTQIVPFGSFFESSSRRIRCALGMPPFIHSTKTQVDSEAFMQVFQVFKFITGKARLPYISADIVLEQVPKYFVWGVKPKLALEATRQALLIGAIKGLLELNGSSSEFPMSNIETLSRSADRIAGWTEQILRVKSNKIRVLQLKRAVAQGKFFKSWGRSKFEEPFPHLPHIYEALRKRHGMPKKTLEEATMDPEVLLQLTISIDYMNEVKETCIPTSSEIYRLLSSAIQNAMKLNNNWINFNYGTKSGTEVAIWSAFLNKPYTKIMHIEQIHFILEKQYTLDVLSSFKKPLHDKFLKAVASGRIEAAWDEMVRTF